jgi:hypothetical protein
MRDSTYSSIPPSPRFTDTRRPLGGWFSSRLPSCKRLAIWFLKFHFDWCRFLEFTAIYRRSIHRVSFVFGWQCLCSLLERILLTLLVDFALIFGAFKGLLYASCVLAWFSILYYFPFIHSIYLFIHKLSLLLFFPHLVWSSPLSIHEYVIFSGQKVPNYRPCGE